MQTADVIAAVSKLGSEKSRTCLALRQVLPLLRTLREGGSSWKFWERWGMDALIAALDGYTRSSCGEG